MTMQHQIHPDDERLAALAGGDPELESDAALLAHVSSCDACRATVDELSMLRSALAELPDLVPSRRLQLVPPVAEPRAARAGGWLRRLSAPIMAAGLGLVLVGAVGTSGLLNFAPASADRLSGAAAAQPSGQDAFEGGGAPATASPRAPLPTYGGSSRSADALGSYPSPTASDNSGSESAPSPSSAASDVAAPTDSGTADLATIDANQSTAPWLALLLAGVGLVLTGGVLRFAGPAN
jgi:hypothetical protein